jgi:hypothetical protein
VTPTTHCARSVVEEVIISTHPEGCWNWHEHGVVSTVPERFQLPITHITVDLEAEVQASS